MRESGCFYEDRPATKPITVCGNLAEESQKKVLRLHVARTKLKLYEKKSLLQARRGIDVNIQRVCPRISMLERWLSCHEFDYSVL